MIFFHLSDLHIGKQLHQYSLREDQEKVLGEVVDYASRLHPDAIVIAGDIYDKSVPAAEAVAVFDLFLTRLAAIRPEIPVLMISGNHDSPERLSYAGKILEQNQIYISGSLPQRADEKLKHIVFYDTYGEVRFYLLPFLKPGYIRHLFKENPPSDYQEAVKAVLAREEIDLSVRNVLISHQLYTGSGTAALTCDSEVFSIGGIDNIDSSVVEMFDYVALGHLHGAQKAGAEHIRYCGTLLKYSVSEAEHKKGLTVVELRDKGTLPVICTLPLSPLRDVRRIKGTLEEILKQAKLEKQEQIRAGEAGTDDYISVTLTDETEPYKVRERLGEAYKHILEVRMDNGKIKNMLDDTDGEKLISDPFSLFRSFYQEICGREMSEAELKVVRAVLDEVKEEA